MNQFAYFGIALLAMLLNTSVSLVMGQAFYHTAFASVMAIGYGLATCFLILLQGHPPRLSGRKWLWGCAIGSLQSASFYLEMAGLLKIGAHQTAAVMASVVVMAFLFHYRKEAFSRRYGIKGVAALLAFGALAIMAHPVWPHHWNIGYALAFLAALSFAGFFYGNHYALKKRIIDPSSLAIISLLTQTIWITPAALFLTRPLPLDFHSGIFAGLLILAVLIAAAQFSLNKAQQVIGAFPITLVFALEPFVSSLVLGIRGQSLPPFWGIAAGLWLVALLLARPWDIEGRKLTVFRRITRK